MGQVVRVIVFNVDEDYGAELRGELLKLDGVKIVAELDEPPLLPQAIQQFQADAVVVHLDPVPEALLEMVRQVVADKADLAVFVISESTNGELILSAMRAGVREFLPKPVDVRQLEKALQRLTQNRPEKPAGRLVSVMGSAGGVGCTTVASNLAVEFAQQVSGGVAIVDLDFRLGQVATVFDVQPQYTIAELCETPEQLDEAMIAKAAVRHETGVFVLARPHHFAQAEVISAGQCAGVLAALQDLYELVVVDGPHRFDGSAQAVFDMSDVNILLMQMMVTSVRNADRLLQELARHGFNLDRMQLVCNRSGRESGHLALDHIEVTLNRKVLWQIPDDFRTVSSSINLGEPLALHAPKSKVRQSIRDLASLILGSDASEAEVETKAKRSGRGLLGRLLQT